MKNLKYISFVGGTLLAFASSSRADLLVNGGFETGDFTGWNVLGVSQVFSGAPFAQSGNYGASLGEGIVAQSVITTPGHVYDLSFDIKQLPAGATGPLKLEWDSTQAVPATDLGEVTLLDTFDLDPSVGWAKYNFEVLALGDVGTVHFEFSTQASTYPNNTALDNVSVTDTGFTETVPYSLGVPLGDPSPVLPDVSPYLVSSSVSYPSAVPEPSTYGLMGALALGGVALLRRRASRV